MAASNIKITETILVKKEFTIDEGELEALLEEHGRKVLGVGSTVPVSVRIDCSSGGYVREVIITSESESSEVK